MTRSRDIVLDRKTAAERMFAASAFMAPAQVLHDAGWMRPEHFRDELIGKFWGELQAHGNQMQAAIRADILGDLLEWVNQTPSAMHARDYANQIVQEAYSLRLIKAMSSLHTAIAKGDVEESRRIVMGMAEEMPLCFEQIPDFGDGALEFIASLDNETDSIPASIDTLNEGLGGWWRGIASVLCARPSMGKTTFGWQEARHASRIGKKVIVFSLEESRRTLIERAACGELKIPIRDTRAGRLTDVQVQDLKERAYQLMEVHRDNLLIDDRTSHTTDSIWQIVAAEKPDLVVVDHLRLLKDVDRWRSEVKRQGYISQRLKEIAKEFNLHMMILAQLNRGVESRADKRPTLSDLRDSGEIEENADLVLGLHREDYYQKTDRPNNTSLTDLNTLKFRNGPIARFILAFDKLEGRFRRGEMEPIR